MRMPSARNLALESIQACALSIPFKAAFKHASAERAATQSLWVQCRSRDGLAGHGEGCPREYVTAESLASAQGFVAAHLHDWLAAFHDLDSLAAWVGQHGAEIDRHPAAWTAVELAFLDLAGKHSGKSIEALLALPELKGRFQYTAVIGDAAAAQFEAQLAHYLKAGFRDFKIKLSGDLARDGDKVRLLGAAGVSPQRVRADANNLWRSAEQASRDLRALDFPFFALEEPLQAGDYAGLRRLAQALDTKIILDESLLRAAQLDELVGFSERCIVNLRVSKMGGLLRSLELAREIRSRGLGLIVGAHVGETSVLTRAALAVAHSARDSLIAQEGAFGTHLLSRDVTESPIMFGAGGILDAERAAFAGKPGLGLVVTHTP
jgi:L-alanine-DL-glutamate epimerase-like enolase superfamily enzyme